MKVSAHARIRVLAYPELRFPYYYAKVLAHDKENTNSTAAIDLTNPVYFFPRAALESL
ncbi:hypothetical protein AM1_C0231 (plasmid) [Acaryochloris marina MBIC11017]|uniref:Uncharacterized protein n=1 Tax=Acaryochloris marina (strain MBIC 11017) TaxID=329726 RepID=A8ZMW5_ACAM1|nr:hypothetical protein AM1_C0231 [Acaryochloris marina MBIC11017]